LQREVGCLVADLELRGGRALGGSRTGEPARENRERQQPDESFHSASSNIHNSMNGLIRAKVRISQYRAIDKPMCKGVAAIVLCCGVAMTTACSDKGQSPTTPTPQTTNVAGTWAGQVSALGNAARMTWTLSQTGTSVNGPVLLSLSSGLVLLNGFLTGSLSGTTLTYLISVGPG